MIFIKFCTEVVKSLFDYEKLSQIERRGSNNAHYPQLIPALEEEKLHSSLQTLLQKLSTPGNQRPVCAMWGQAIDLCSDC